MAKQTKKRGEEVLFDLVEAGHSTQSFIQKYQNHILIGAAAILVIVGAFFAYKLIWQEPRERDAMEELFKAEQRFEQDSFALALENPGEGYLGFLDISEDYKGTRAGNIANYYSGISYLRLGRYEAAISYLKDFDPTGEFTPIAKHGAMGDAYSEMDEMDKAVSEYKKAVEAGSNELLTPYYTYKLGMLLRALSRNEEAVKYFKMIVEEYPGASQVNDVKKYYQD